MDMRYSGGPSRPSHFLNLELQFKITYYCGICVLYFRVAIWLYARPNKSNLALYDRSTLGFEIFGLAFWTIWHIWASLALNTKVWP